VKEKENLKEKVNVEPDPAVVVGDEEEDAVGEEASLVDSTDVGEAEVDEPRAEGEEIKREETATQRTMGLTKVLRN